MQIHLGRVERGSTFCTFCLTASLLVGLWTTMLHITCSFIVVVFQMNFSCNSVLIFFCSFLFYPVLPHCSLSNVLCKLVLYSTSVVLCSTVKAAAISVWKSIFVKQAVGLFRLSVSRLSFAFRVIVDSKLPFESADIACFWDGV